MKKQSMIAVLVATLVLTLASMALAGYATSPTRITWAGMSNRPRPTR